MTARERIENRSIAILGMARSGLAAAELANVLGAQVFVSDSANSAALTDAITQLERAKIAYETDGHSERVLQCDFAVISPGIPSDAPIVSQLRESGRPVFSELEFASWVLRGKMISVTGSNGKTTTASMIHSIMQADNRQSVLCGNIGTPFSGVVQGIDRDGVAVVEVSSYQLEFVDQFHPDVAVITNLSPDHLERHGSMSAYREAKLRITDAQIPADTLCLNIDSDDLDALAVSTDAKRICFGAERSLKAGEVSDGFIGAFQRGSVIFAKSAGLDVKLLDVSELQIPGQHNVENAMSAASAALAFGASLEAIRKGLREFTGVEHRIEFVAEVNGVTFVNDSKATNLDATTKALAALKSPIRLILGGRGKGEDFAVLLPHLTGRVKSVVAIGETKEEIFSTLGKSIAVQFAANMSEAVAKIFDESISGEVALLSPGCASFDQYNNFEERGNDFKQLVKALAKSEQEDVVKN